VFDERRLPCRTETMAIGDQAENRVQVEKWKKWNFSTFPLGFGPSASARGPDGRAESK
jgi:hypothetical protein